MNEVEETEVTKRPGPRTAGPIVDWIRERRILLLMIVGTVAVIWLPFYGNLYPPLVDLPEHLLVSKLLWETLVGTSSLDLQLTSFLGYKLFPYFSLLFIGLLKLVGISLIYLPKVMSTVLIGLFAGIAAWIGVSELEDRRWPSAVAAAGFILPAAVSMYVACWFIGFVNYTLGITLLIPAIYFSDRFLSRPKLKNALLTFASLALAYMAHPFVPTFWLIWCFGRGLASITLWRLPKEWLRFLLLGATFAPIGLYHLAATAGSPLAPATDVMAKESPFLPFSEWMKNRFWPLLDGMYLKADDVADGSLFAIFAILFVLAAVFVAFWFRRDDSSRSLILASIVTAITASVINEKFIPVPSGHWLAYDYRFASTIYAICVVSASIVIIRHLPLILADAKFRLAAGILAAVAAMASFGHVLGVRSAYARYDTAARPFMEKVLDGQQPTGMTLPHSRWHPDGTLIKLYICMVQIDCNPPGTTFIHGYSGDLYPVKYGSIRPQVTHVQAVPSATTAAPAGSLSSPRGIAVDDKGKYYVADSGSGRIQMFSPDGKFAASFGEARLKDPNGITITDSGDIFVTDARENKLFKFDKNGNYAAEWTGPTPGFYGPRDVAAGPNQTLYIIDQGRSRIVRFDIKSGQFSEWGSQGELDGQFHEPTGITVAGGLVYVADNGNGRIQVFDLTGKFVRQWPVPEWEKYVWHYPDLAYDDDKKVLYVSSGTTKQVFVFDPSGNRADALNIAGLDNPSSITVAKVNKKPKLFVLNTGNGTVSQFELTRP